MTEMDEVREVAYKALIAARQTFEKTIEQHSLDVHFKLDIIAAWQTGDCEQVFKITDEGTNYDGSK